MALFRIAIAGDALIKDCIAKALGTVMTKAIELQYSGTGKIINGQGKSNFSSTNTYLCLRGKIVSTNIKRYVLYSLFYNIFI